MWYVYYVDVRWVNLLLPLPLVTPNDVKCNSRLANPKLLPQSLHHYLQGLARFKAQFMVHWSSHKPCGYLKYTHVAWMWMPIYQGFFPSTRHGSASGTRYTLIFGPLNSQYWITTHSTHWELFAWWARPKHLIPCLKPIQQAQFNHT